jgi:hypothetical protein
MSTARVLLALAALAFGAAVMAADPPGAPTVQHLVDDLRENDERVQKAQGWLFLISEEHFPDLMRRVSPNFSSRDVRSIASVLALRGYQPAVAAVVESAMGANIQDAKGPEELDLAHATPAELAPLAKAIAERGVPNPAGARGDELWVSVAAASGDTTLMPLVGKLLDRGDREVMKRLAGRFNADACGAALLPRMTAATATPEQRAAAVDLLRPGWRQGPTAAVVSALSGSAAPAVRASFARSLAGSTSAAAKDAATKLTSDRDDTVRAAAKAALASWAGK